MNELADETSLCSIRTAPETLVPPHPTHPVQFSSGDQPLSAVNWEPVQAELQFKTSKMATTNSDAWLVTGEGAVLRVHGAVHDGLAATAEETSRALAAARPEYSMIWR